MEKKKPNQPRSPRMVGAAAELYAQYGKYALPDDELRKLMDEVMGTKTLTRELYKMRREK